MSIESAGDARGMRHVGRMVALILAEMQAAARPGVTTAALDAVGAAAMARLGVRPAPQVTYGFPGLTCISVNDETSRTTRTAGSATCSPKASSSPSSRC